MRRVSTDDVLEMTSPVPGTIQRQSNCVRRWTFADWMWFHGAGCALSGAELGLGVSPGRVTSDVHDTYRVLSTRIQLSLIHAISDAAAFYCRVRARSVVRVPAVRTRTARAESRRACRRKRNRWLATAKSVRWKVEHERDDGAITLSNNCIQNNLCVSIAGLCHYQGAARWSGCHRVQRGCSRPREGSLPVVVERCRNTDTDGEVNKRHQRGIFHAPLSRLGHLPKFVIYFIHRKLAPFYYFSCTTWA
jgi:hypothetical protein